MAEPVEYYAAAILHLIESFAHDKAHFSEVEIDDWMYEDIDFSIEEPVYKRYLPDKKLISSALILLENLECIFKVVDRYGPDVFQILDRASLDLIADNDVHSVYFKVDNFGEPWLRAALTSLHSENRGENSNNLLSQENTEDNWQPLPIDREDQLYLKAIEAVEDALKVIEGDNGYAATESEERTAILEPAKATLTAIKDGTPSKEQIESNLVKPFKYLMKKFGDSLIGAAAKKIVGVIVTWLPDLFS